MTLSSLRYASDPLETDCFVTNEGSKISLTNGRILASDPQKLRIYDSPVKKIVMNLMIEQGIYSSDDDLSHLRCFVENQSVHIRDFNKRLDFVVNLNGLNPKNSEVYLNLGGEIGRALYKPMEERKYISNHELKRKYHHLVANDRLYLCDPVTFKPLLQSDSQIAGASIIATIPEAVGEESLIVS